MTSAPVGQGGTNHVNCQPKEYWIEKMEKRGFIIDWVTTGLLTEESRIIIGRNHCNINYLPNNFMYFTKV
jgi:hypothetical protein